MTRTVTRTTPFILILILILAAVLPGLACKDSKPAVSDAPASVRLADAAPSMVRPPALDAASGGAPEPAAATDGGASAQPEEASARPSGKKIGVEACDEYLDKMARCLGRLSKDSAETMRGAMEETRRAWQQTASTPEGAATLADACRSALDAAKGAAKSLGCSW